MTICSLMLKATINLIIINKEDVWYLLTVSLLSARSDNFLHFRENIKLHPWIQIHCNNQEKYIILLHRNNIGVPSSFVPSYFESDLQVAYPSFNVRKHLPKFYHGMIRNSSSCILVVVETRVKTISYSTLSLLQFC